MIIDDLLDLIEKRKDIVKELKLSSTCVSIFYTAVMLENNYVGLCYTPREDIGHPTGKPRPSFRGTRVVETAQMANSLDMIERAVGIATLNAISQYLMEFEGYERQFGVDASNVLKLRKRDRVVVVGYIRPIVEKLRAKVRELRVLERNPQMRGDALPDTLAEVIVPKADVVVISGSSLVNGTLDRLLELSKRARLTGVVGPTASMLPEPLFKRGANVVAGVQAKGSEVLDAVGEAKTFRDFKTLVEKYIIKR